MKLVVHYKGGLYIELARGTDSTNGAQGADLVVYYSLRERRTNFRERREFDERVSWPDGVMRPRFCEARTAREVVELYRASGDERQE